MPRPGEGIRIRVVLAGLTVRELAALLPDGVGDGTSPPDSVAGDGHGRVTGDRARVPGERLSDRGRDPNAEGRISKALRGRSDAARIHELRARLRQFAKGLTPCPAGVKRFLVEPAAVESGQCIRWARVILDMGLRSWSERHGHDKGAWSKWERGLRPLPEWTATERLLLEQDMAAAVEKLEAIFGECRGGSDG